MIECPNCKTKLEKGDAFCTNCGTKVEAPKKTTKKSTKPKTYCTNCGNAMDPTDNFCTNCGNAMDPTDNFCTNCGFNPNQVVEAPSSIVEQQVSTSNEVISKNFVEENMVGLIVFCLGLVLVFVGIVLIGIPDRVFSFYYIEEYVGGDAYNALIEASIRGGEIAGAMISKAVCICSGLIISAIGAINIKLK